MDSKVTYRQQVSFCGKPQCRKCREGVGHGPYWYAYHTSEQGRTVRTYVGKQLPSGVQTAQIASEALASSLMPASARRGAIHSAQRDSLAIVDERIAQGAYATAIEPLDRLLAANPTDEAAVQRLIFVLARLKRRGEAIRAYQKFVAALQSRYNMEPSTRTTSLIEAVQRGDEPLPAPTKLQNTGEADAINRSLRVEERADAINRSLPDKDVGYVGRTHQKPLVGRESELAALREFVFATAGEMQPSQMTGNPDNASLTQRAGSLPLDTKRRPQWMLLQGEAGIGKTRLVEEVGAQAQQEGWAVLWSRMFAQESSIPYRQWIEILRSAALQGLWQIEDMQGEETTDVFAPLGVLLPELYSEMQRQADKSAVDVMSRPPRGLGEGDGADKSAVGAINRPLQGSPQQEQQRLWEAVLALFVLMSRKQPLLVVLDDLQWADSSSCELLGYFARRLSGQPVRFIGACRESELAPNHVLHSLVAHMQREHTITTLAIQPMSDAQIRQLVGHLPSDIVKYIQQQSAGNPFFAEELALSSDVERKEVPSLPSSAASPTFPDGRQPLARHKQFTLPTTIRVALDHRISKLSRSCQQLLSDAAVMGGSFEFTLIRAMESYGANQKDEDTVLDLLDEALQAGVLAEEGRGTRIRYHFWHPLLVSHLYERLSASKRALLHRRVADILQQLYARREEEGAATITYHLLEGGAEDERLVHFAELAGNSAYLLSAYPDAEGYYRLVIDRIGTESTQALKRAFLLERLGECARIQGHFEDARHAYEQILAQRKKANVPAQDLPGDWQQDARVEALLWCEVAWACYYTGDKARAIACREEGEQVLLNAGLAYGPAWATLRYQNGFISWQEGNYDEAYAAASEARVLFEEALQQQRPPDGRDTFSTRIRRTLAGDPVDLARIHRLLGSIANSVGRPGEGLLHLNTALTILEHYGQKREVGHVCCNIGYIHLQKAEYEQAHVFFQRSLSVAEQVGDTPLTSVIYSNLGIMAARTGKLSEAEDWYRRGLLLAEQINDQVYVSMWNTLLSDVLQQQSRLSEARTCLCRALLLGKKVGNTPCIGLALVSAGTLRIAQAQTARQKHRKVQGTRYLKQASAALHRALALEGLEAETRAEGQLAQAQVALLLGNVREAQQQVSAVLVNAQAHELTYLTKRAQQFMKTL